MCRITAVTGCGCDRVNARELDLNRGEEIRSVDRHLLSGLSPLERHSGDLRCWRKDLEVISDHLTILSVKIYLVGLFDRQCLGNRDKEGLRCHIAGVQNGRLVIEVDVVDAGEVVTHDAQHLFHIGLGDNHVLIGVADEIHRGDSRSLDETVRIVNGVASGEKQRTQNQAFICRFNFHLRFN